MAAVGYVCAICMPSFIKGCCVTQVYQLVYVFSSDDPFIPFSISPSLFHVVLSHFHGVLSHFVFFLSRYILFCGVLRKAEYEGNLFSHASAEADRRFAVAGRLMNSLVRII